MIARYRIPALVIGIQDRPAEDLDRITIRRIPQGLLLAWGSWIVTLEVN